MVPKSHVESEHPLVEWKLSFAFFERKLLLDIPEYQRSAYIILKDEIKKRRRWIYKNKFKSYHLKTILLESIIQPYNGEKSVYQYQKMLYNRLYNAYQSGRLFNFFIPEQNLLEKGDEMIAEILDRVSQKTLEFRSVIYDLIKRFPSLKEIRTYFLILQFEELNEICLKKLESYEIVTNFNKINFILRSVDADLADSLSVEILENYLEKCRSMLPCKLPWERQDYEELSGGMSTLDMNKIGKHLKSEMERVKQEISQTEESEQVDKFYQSVTELILNNKDVYENNKEYFNKTPSKFQSFIDIFQTEYNKQLDRNVLRFNLEEMYFEMVCIFLELFKQIFHSDNRENKKEIQSKLETILDDIQETSKSLTENNLDSTDTVEKSKGKLGDLLKGFYEMVRFPEGESEEEIKMFEEDLKVETKILLKMNYDKNHKESIKIEREYRNKKEWLSGIATEINFNIDFDEKYLIFISKEMKKRLEDANTCICNKTILKDMDDIFLSPINMFVEFCQSHSILHSFFDV